MDETSSANERLKKIAGLLIPPVTWKIPVFILLGIGIGLVVQILYVSNAVSYLSDNPETCVNCHIMAPQFATWERGSHGRTASCNDCHVPQNNVIRKYFFKASDGLRHATMFTFRMEPQVIRIKDAGKAAVQENCIRCHSNYLHPVSLRYLNPKGIHENTEQVCWDCHREVPHGRVNSLTSAPYARVPQLKPVTPDWFTKFLKTE